MSRKNGSNKQVLDEEGTVDSKVKDTILKARNRVDKARFELDVQEPMNPEVSLPEAQKVEIFSKMVKQFLIRIEPLLSADSVKGNKTYYHGGDEPLATFELVPPDTEGYRLSLVTQDKDAETLRRMIGLPRGVELPEPMTVTFRGLKDIIEKPSVVSHQWEVCTANQGAPPNWEYIYPVEQRMVPKSVYRDAMRDADQFLQEIGIGVQTGLPEVDDQSEEPF